MTKIIAELCVNHMGKTEIAESMIFSAKEVGVDMVKIQSFQSNKLKKGNKEDYKIYELTDDQHIVICELCKKYEIELLTTCFDTGRIPFLKNLGFNKIKIASPDIVNYELLDSVFENFNEVIVSTASATRNEIDKFVIRYRKYKNGNNITLMHCNPHYPTDLIQVNLLNMIDFKNQYHGFNVGFSDHTIGTDASKIAICLGADYIEKHMTLNRYLPGPDQSMATTVDEFEELVEWNKKVTAIMGPKYEQYINPDILSLELFTEDVNSEYIDNFRNRWINE